MKKYGFYLVTFILAFTVIHLTSPTVIPTSSHQKRAAKNMALPSTITGRNGTSVTTANDVYTLSSGTDANGNKYYVTSNPNYGAVYASGTWSIGAMNGATGALTSSPDYHNSTGGLQPTNFPLTGWDNSLTFAPAQSDVTAPAFSSSSIQSSGNSAAVSWVESASPPVLQSTGFGATQGITFTGFTGGAVTVNGVVSTSGTTTTVTLSRTILGTETGGLISIAASAFSDSATPTANLTSQITNSAVTNSSTAVASLPLPGAPTITSAVAGNNQVALTWTAGTGTTTSFNVKRSLTLGGAYSNLSAGTGITGTTFTDTTAVNGTQYFYKVSGVNATGEGVSSSAYPNAGVTPTGTTAGPTNLTAVYTIAQGITLNWTNPTGNNFIGINIYRLWGTNIVNINNVPQRIDQTPFQYVAPATTTFVDRLVGTGLAFLSGSNLNSYFVAGVLPNGTESPPSNIAGPVSFNG